MALGTPIGLSLGKYKTQEKQSVINLTMLLNFFKINRLSSCSESPNLDKFSTLFDNLDALGTSKCRLPRNSCA